jgi:hypothetical protein
MNEFKECPECKSKIEFEDNMYECTKCEWGYDYAGSRYEKEHE